MIVYFLAFAITLLFYYLSVRFEKKRNIFLILSILPFFIIPAIRYNVGIDTSLNYGPIFKNVAIYGDQFNEFEFLLQKYEIRF